MNAEEILKEVRRLGGRAEARGDRLHIDAPVGRITEELKERLRQNKAEILKHLDLESRLAAERIAIAIDRQTGAALLLLSESDREAVKNVATVHRPFEVILSSKQRSELTADLAYYEQLIARQKRRRTDAKNTEL